MDIDVVIDCGINHYLYQWPLVFPRYRRWFCRPDLIMSNVAIRTVALAKKYRVRPRERYKTLRDTLVSSFSRVFHRRAINTEPYFLALRDISIEVQHGEALGIIGHNGAGKTTLLKLLSRITRPTSGEAHVWGRIASLLEVGTGFHPELTGRENIYFSGAILGMSKTDIAKHFDEIVDFSGCEKFLDTPMKRYSSGMQTRLAFAVAAHLEPEILLVDEVLAVGDAEFQKKCLTRLGDAVRDGRTMIFVSHNMPAVQSFCGRAICLRAGEIVADGPTTNVVSAYLKQYLCSKGEVCYDEVRAPGTKEVRLRRVSVHREDHAPEELISVRTPFVIEVEYWALEPDLHLDVAVSLHNAGGVIVFSTGTVANPEAPVGLLRSTCYVPGDFLNDGTYRIELVIALNQTIPLYHDPEVLTFDVVDSPDLRGAWYGEWPGATRPNLQWGTVCVEPREVLLAPDCV